MGSACLASCGGRSLQRLSVSQSCDCLPFSRYMSCVTRLSFPQSVHVLCYQAFLSTVSTCPVLPGFSFQSVHVLCYQAFLSTVSTCPVLPDFSFHSQYMSCGTRLCPSSTTCNSFSQSIGSCINCCLSITTDVTVSTFLHYPTSINHN